MFYESLINRGISPRVCAFVEETEKDPITARAYARAHDIAAVNQLKVLRAMQDCRLGDAHFTDSTGYGYHDVGRQALEDIFAAVFHAEAALVRPQLISGTHALATALFGNLRPGDTLLSPAGAPYDTLESVIGIRPAAGSLAEYGIAYRQVELTGSGGFDYPAILRALTEAPTAMITIQRSKGYAWRPSFTVAQIGELIAEIRKIRPEAIILVDNCYGELVEEREPGLADKEPGRRACACGRLHRG
jgi:cystathionine beta-lyase family protein involved in aluminum resistance